MAKKAKRPRRRRPEAQKTSVREVSRAAVDELGLTDDQRQAIAASWVHFHEERYSEADWTDYVEGWTGPWSSPPTARPSSRRKVGNPLAVWGAYLECRAAKLPLPEWVLAYFDRVASRLTRRVSAGMPSVPKNPAAAIAADLEMVRQGAGSVFAHWDRQDELLMAAEVERRMSHGEGVTASIRNASKALSKGEQTVERAWRKHRNTLP